MLVQTVCQSSGEEFDKRPDLSRTAARKTLYSTQSWGYFMGRAKTVADYTTLYSKLGHASFLKKYQGPVLVGRGMIGDLTENANAAGSGTMAVVVPDALSTMESSMLVGRVWPIQKGPYSAPGPVITVGRSRDCDVVIQEYSLSQTHCEFRFEPPKVIIIDSGSLNGTQINGNKPPPNEPVALPERAELILGRFGFLYLGPGQLAALIQERLAEVG